MLNDGERFEQIDPTRIDALLQEYHNVVPQKLNELDEQRYNVIPAAVKKRGGDAMLTKEEVVTLAKWKLSHGKWRPTLQALVERNADSVVKDLTKNTFRSFSDANKTSDQAKQAITALSKLQGIGPATASLLLSVFDPVTAPFFSDELFRWCFLEDAKGKAWDRDIKYNAKEYLELYSRVQDFTQRFKDDFQRDISAVEVEKVAYVLGKTAVTGSSTTNSKKRKAEIESNDTIRKVPAAKPRSNRAKTTSRAPSNVSNTTKVSMKGQLPQAAATNITTAAANRSKRTKKS